MRDLDPNSERPLYRQLTDVLREAIRAGEFSPGEKLPSRQQLRDRYNLAPMTINRAIDELHHEGLIVRRQGSGMFVRTEQLEQHQMVPPNTWTKLYGVDLYVWHDLDRNVEVTVTGDRKILLPAEGNWKLSKESNHE